MAERNRTSRNNKIERFQHVDEDVSSSDEADPNRQKRDNSGSIKRKRESKLKNVRVLLDDDVRKEDGKVYMLNSTEMAHLKKPERGQLKTKIKLTETMTAKNVEEKLRQHFPILRDNGRLSCATAVHKRDRLEFHNSPERIEDGPKTVWDGAETLLDDLGISWDDPGTSQDDPGTSWDGPGTSPNDPRTQMRFSCASAADNRTRLEFHNSPGTAWNGSGTVWDGTKINRLIRRNSVLYVLFEVRRSVESNNSSDSAFESTTGNASGVDDNTEHSTVITKLCPKEGPIMGGTQFVICLNVKSIPENLTSLKAIFKEVGFVDLTPVTEGVYSGCSPASKTLGKVAVTVGSPDGTWNSPEETEFEYYPDVTQEFRKLIAKMPDTKRNIPLDYQTLNPSSSAGTVCSPSSFSSVVDTSLMADESKDILSLKALQGILFAAAAANDRECIETIFSTSAGEAVFQTYRNSSILPENTARAMGHKELAEYLQNIHKRLSEEIVCNVQTVTIDWVELKHATAKKDICSGTDESQGLELESFLESDDDQTSYFADDETSICQSPSASEFEDECIELKCQDDLIQQLSKKHFTVSMATGRSSIKMPCENEDSPEEENAPDFDEDTLRATADVYRNEGNEAFKKGDFINAIHFYTKGIKMNYNEKELKAKLYNNRAIAHFKLGNHQDLLRDAEAAIELNPTFLKAIVRGATACVELKRFEEAITWCDKGLAIDRNNGILLSLSLRSVGEVEDETMEEKDPISHGSANSGDVKIAQEVGDKHEDSNTNGNLGNAYYNLGDFKKAIEYHNRSLKIAKKVGDKHGEGNAYGNLGYAYCHLGDCKKAIAYHNLHLKIAKEVGDMHGEGYAYCNLGSAYHLLGDFKKAIEYHNLQLRIAKEVGDKHEEGNANGNLGTAYEKLGDCKKAIKYQNLRLKIAKEIGDIHGEGCAYGNLGNAYHRLSYFKKAIEYHNLHLKIAKEVGDKHGEGFAFGNLGIAYRSLGDFKKTIEYHNLHLTIAKELGDKHEEGNAYCNLGIAYQSLSDFKKAIEYHNLCLKIAKEVGNKHKEGVAYGNLGSVYHSLGDFKKAIEYQQLRLKIAKEVGEMYGKGDAYGNLGNAYHSLCDFKKAVEYHNLHLKIAKEVGDKRGEGIAYGNLGNNYHSLGDFKTAIEFHSLYIKITKEVGDKHGEGNAYGNLGAAYQSLGDFKKAIAYHNLSLKIAKEVGDKHGEGRTYGNLGIAYGGLGDFEKAVEYNNLHLKIAKELGDKHGEGNAHCNLGNAYRRLDDLIKAKESYNLVLNISKEIEDKSLEANAYYSLACVFESKGGLPKAVEHYQASINLYNSLRVLLKSKDEWKVNFRNQYQMAYSGLWRVLVKQGNIDEALFAAEKGRAQALTDLMEFSFCGGTNQRKGGDEDLAVLNNVPTVFQAVEEAYVNLWVVSEGKQVQLRQSKLKGFVSENSGASQSFESSMLGVYTQLDVRSNVKCENRSLDALRESRSKVDEKTKEANPQPPVQQNECLSTLYDIVMKPVADLLKEDELLIIPDGPLWLVPYAALKDGNSKYLCESFRIRLAPSLTSLRLIADCPDDYHKSSGALLVGNPWVAEVTDSKGEKLFEQLPYAKEEVEMIGKILNITPITGRQATKREVLKRLSSVSLVHFAAHGCMETGQIALTPDPDRISAVPTEEDYILTIGDVLNAQLRAKLVVLSCCHSGRGEIKAEGVVGIARAFMGSGARSVVVSLWAIDDVATLEFMKYFYQHLAEGKPASASLNLAMKSLRESDKFCDIKYWAPFLLIGDDVTLNFTAKEREN